MNTAEKEPLRFSLIMTTRGGGRLPAIARFLKSLREQTYKRYEVIVIFQSAEYEAENELLGRFPELSGHTVVVTPLCSLSHARNIGLRHAKFDVVAFPDDDCWYPAGLLSYVRNQLEGSSLDGLCLGIFDPYRSRPYGKRPLNVRVPLKPSNAFYLPISVGLFIRSRVLATGAPDGFDERLGAGTRWGAGEETDLVCQLLDNNVPMEYDSRATVYHETASYSRNDVPKYLSYGRGFGAALGKRVARGDLHPFLTLLDIAARSALGALVNLLRFRFVPCGVYLNRGAGMIQGFIEALRHYRMSREQTRC